MGTKQCVHTRSTPFGIVQNSTDQNSANQNSINLNKANKANPFSILYAYAYKMLK